MINVKRYLTSYIEVILVCGFILLSTITASNINKEFKAVESVQSKESVEQQEELSNYGQAEIEYKMYEIYSTEKDDILNTVVVQDEEINKILNNYKSLDEVRLLTLEDGNVFYVLKEDTREYKVGSEVNGSKVKDVRYATKDEVKSIIKSELIIEKANEELYRRALTSLESKDKK